MDDTNLDPQWSSEISRRIWASTSTEQKHRSQPVLNLRLNQLPSDFQKDRYFILGALDSNGLLLEPWIPHCEPWGDISWLK